jgi:cytochrome P450
MQNVETTLVQTPTQAQISRVPPKMRALPVLGVMPGFLFNPTELLLDAAAQHPGEIVRLPMGPSSIYLMAEPRHAQHVLSDNWRNYGKGPMWAAPRRLLGSGLVTAEGDVWLRHRRIVQPVFAPKHLSTIVESMVGTGRELAGSLEAKAGTTVDVADEMTRLIQAVFLRSIFGAEPASEDAATVAKAIVEALAAVNLRAFLHFMPKWFPFPGERALVRNIATIDRIVLGVVAKARQGASGNDLLSLLLAARDEKDGQGLDDRELRDELVAQFVVGTDTTAVALMWLWHVLDAHPAVQEKLCAEIDRVLGGREPTFADLAELTYTKAVIQETMRLFPVSWIIPRVAEKDDTIDGYEIPAGANVMVSEWVTHRLPAYWDRPTEFDPDRFEPTVAAKRARFAYFPFGGGPRACIGAQLAMMMMQTMVALIAPRLRLIHASSKPVRPQPTITLRPKGGLQMRVELR